ncbi:DUF421 domain-containing protein [Paenibacillus sp. GCM10012307]|uniref:DUF421 domain-containing protein n=1 Tax=Paenibacillus roseus TaxID=2798579 RepID=A0A934J4Z0_9BACL|nr:DUF421 domain-containing protein [Paenibacillus roseus]MBJ6362955.1 DUF421 domain-containing protein [Paenibacillus roseus]
MEYMVIILRTILIYFVVYAVLRLMGKREIGKLTVFDLVISIMIAEIAVIVIEDTKRPLAEELLPIAVLMILQIGIAWMIMKSRKMRLLFDGKPSILIENGKLNRDEMKKQRYNFDDLLVQLREKDMVRLADVEFAILETSGKLSVIKKEQGQYLAKTDFQFPPNYRFEDLPVPLIMDGEVQEENLQKLNRSWFWLKNELKKHQVADTKSVFLCTIDHKGRLYVDTGGQRLR